MQTEVPGDSPAPIISEEEFRRLCLAEKAYVEQGNGYIGAARARAPRRTLERRRRAFEKAEHTAEKLTKYFRLRGQKATRQRVQMQQQPIRPARRRAPRPRTTRTASTAQKLGAGVDGNDGSGSSDPDPDPEPAVAADLAAPCAALPDSLDVDREHRTGVFAVARILAGGEC